MSLSKKQQRFTARLSELLAYAHAKGYRLTLGDGYRDPRVFGDFGEKKAYASANSVHKLRLAIDLNLFINGEYVTDGAHSAYADLGRFWKSLDPDARWGGDFLSGDSNHFSFTHWGAQ